MYALATVSWTVSEKTGVEAWKLVRRLWSWQQENSTWTRTPQGAMRSGPAPGISEAGVDDLLMRQMWNRRGETSGWLRVLESTAWSLELLCTETEKERGTCGAGGDKVLMTQNPETQGTSNRASGTEAADGDQIGNLKTLMGIRTKEELDSSPHNQKKKKNQMSLYLWVGLFSFASIFRKLGYCTLRFWGFFSPMFTSEDTVKTIIVVQPLSHVQLFGTPWIAAHQVSLSFTISWSLLKLMSIELVMPFNHLIPCRPLFLLPSISPSIRVFSNESALRIRWPKYWSFSFSIRSSNEYSGLIYFRIDWFDPLAVQKTLKSLLQHHSS